MSIKRTYLAALCCFIAAQLGRHVDAGYMYHYMQEVCDTPGGFTIDLKRENSTYGFVRLTRDYQGYQPNLHCKLRVVAHDNHFLTLKFRRIDIYKPESDCTTDRLYLSGNTTTHEFCGTWTPSYSYFSTGTVLELEFFSGNWTHDNDQIGFDLYYTEYHHGSCDTGSGRQFYCWNHHCIDGDLTCDNLDNCGDWSDERVHTCGMGTGSIIMLSLISVLCCGTCIAAAVYFAIDKKKDRNRRSRRRSDVTPSVDYHVRSSYGNSPPPYTSHFTVPPYSAMEEKPPAYSNLGYDLGTGNTADVTDGIGATTAGTTAADTVATGADTTATANQLPASAATNNSDVTTESVYEMPASPSNQRADPGQLHLDTMTPDGDAGVSQGLTRVASDA